MNREQTIPKDAVWEAMLYAAVPYAGKKELEEYYSADPAVVLPEKARKRIHIRIRRERRYREAHDIYRPIWVNIQRILLVVVTVLAAAMVSFLPSEKVRDAMWDTMLEWGEESILVSFVGGDTADVPAEILEYREPRGIGTEFERMVIEEEKHKYFVKYTNGGTIITYEQKTLIYNDVYISNEETTGTIVKIGEYEGVLNEFTVNSIPFKSIAFSDGSYAYLIFANTSIEDLIRIAKSIE